MQRLLLASVLFAAFFGAQSWLPEHLSNFQNEYACDSGVRLVRYVLANTASSSLQTTPCRRPLTISDVQEAVKLHSRVTPVGNGLSYNKASQAVCHSGSPTDDVPFLLSGVFLFGASAWKQEDICQYRHDNDQATDHRCG